MLGWRLLVQEARIDETSDDKLASRLLLSDFLQRPETAHAPDQFHRFP